MSLPLKSGELLTSALLHREHAQTLQSLAQEQRQRWQQGFALVEGEAFEAGQAMLGRNLEAWLKPAGIFEQASAILEQTAKAQAELEQWMHRLSHIPQFILDAIPALNGTFALISALGNELDAACAAELNSLCAQAQDTPALGNLDGAQVLQLGDGTAVVAFGSLDEASSIITMVPGVGSSNPETWPEKIEDARTVAASTGAATVAWMGYVAPPNVVGGIAHRPAHQGAAALQEFQDSLRQRNPDAKLIVLGHSYGSTVTGLAAHEGLEADTIIYAGSPGVKGYPKNEDTKIIATLNAQDPIGLSGNNFGAIHGLDPASAGYRSEKWPIAARGHSYVDKAEFLERLKTEVE
ncbi:alpha/beta hydrolase [Corynebacterium gerontici]|uniref:DUF1023 domain-containing protein n=1 Tax=Corynebacterium gerontici TaxID=2079234 RepID=A0A3G6J395_9CORY|nr:alpha/beta hydrolase [Corynebacterium gerontici]AZA10584.1 hypothetical protein CGERO_01250 [Corynebacterium gerontici]